MASLLVVNEREFGPEAVGDLKSIPVLRILLGDLGSDELLSRDTHSQDETLDTASDIFEPDPNRIFNEVLPMFVLSMMQELLIPLPTDLKYSAILAINPIVGCSEIVIC